MKKIFLILFIFIFAIIIYLINKNQYYLSREITANDNSIILKKNGISKSQFNLKVNQRNKIEIFFNRYISPDLIYIRGIEGIFKKKIIDKYFVDGNNVYLYDIPPTFKNIELTYVSNINCDKYSDEKLLILKKPDFIKKNINFIKKKDCSFEHLISIFDGNNNINKLKKNIVSEQKINNLNKNENFKVYFKKYFKPEILSQIINNLLLVFIFLIILKKRVYK